MASMTGLLSALFLPNSVSEIPMDDYRAIK
jgi:hypothetical protein